MYLSVEPMDILPWWDTPSSEEKQMRGFSACRFEAIWGWDMKFTKGRIWKRLECKLWVREQESVSLSSSLSPCRPEQNRVGHIAGIQQIFVDWIMNPKTKLRPRALLSQISWLKSQKGHLLPKVTQLKMWQCWDRLPSLLTTSPDSGHATAIQQIFIAFFSCARHWTNTRRRKMSKTRKNQDYGTKFLKLLSRSLETTFSELYV